MFESLGRRLGDIFNQLRGKSQLTEADVTAALRHIRVALLEADVALPAIAALMNDVKEHAVGERLLKSLAPDQMVIKAVHDALIRLLSPDEGVTGQEIFQENNLIPGAQNWKLSDKKRNIFLMAGLQGSGKTTMSSKIAWLFKDKKVLLASLDVYRPAAQTQLEILGQSMSVDTLPIVVGEKPLDIAQRALHCAQNYDLLIIDTAGRLHIDADMMEELYAIKALTHPDEIILVVDALSGQDGLTTAKAFHHAIGITSIGLSRVDGDGRGGVALSLRHATGCPIKVMGMGENPSDVMLFDPKRLADRILDKGDIVGLVEKAQNLVQSVDQEASLKRLQKGIFTLEDLSQNLKQLESMGGIKGVLDFLPGMRGLKDQLNQQSAKELDFKKQQAIIGSMTIKERRKPELLNASRKQRIARGSGSDVQAVNRLLEHFFQMQKMMKSLKKNPPQRWGR